MNCFRGPATMLPWLREIRKAVTCHVAALPVPYRTTEEEPTFFNLSDRGPCQCPSPRRPFPTAPRSALLQSIRDRRLCERGPGWASTISASAAARRPCSSGRSPKRSVGPPRRAGPEMANHFLYGTNERIADHIRALGDRA